MYLTLQKIHCFQRILFRRRYHFQLKRIKLWILMWWLKFSWHALNRQNSMNIFNSWHRNSRKISLKMFGPKYLCFEHQIGPLTLAQLLISELFLLWRIEYCWQKLHEFFLNFIFSKVWRSNVETSYKRY